MLVSKWLSPIDVAGGIEDSATVAQQTEGALSGCAMSAASLRSTTFGLMSDISTKFSPDAVMMRVGEGIGLREHGERASARQLFEELWQSIGGESGDAFHRCAIAHSMADARDNLEEELMWDLRAFDAAASLSDERVFAGGGDTPAAAFYPSLHLNLADCYRRLGEFDRAIAHLERGRATLGHLPEGGYRGMISAGLDRQAQRLALGDMAD